MISTLDTETIDGSATKKEDTLTEDINSYSKLGNLIPTTMNSNSSTPKPKKALKDMISVVIPTFNRDILLKQAIQSVLCQEKEFMVEFVIVDDGSKDNTKTYVIDWLIKKINEDAIIKKDYKLIYLYNNDGPRGPSYSRNIGMSHCTGDYIYFLDSDDVLYDNTSLLTLYRGLKQYEKENVHFVYGDSIMLDNSYSEMWHVKHLFRFAPFELKKLVSSEGLIPTGSFMFTKKVKETVANFKEDMVLGEDFEWQLRIAEKYDFKHINKVIMKYFRSQTGSLNTVSKDPRIIKHTQDTLLHTKCSIPKERILGSKSAEVFNISFPTSLDLREKLPEIDMLERVLEKMGITGDSDSVMIDIFFDNEYYSNTYEHSDESMSNDIIWILSEPSNLNKELKFLSTYGTIVTFNCALSHKISERLGRHVNTQSFPFSEEIFPLQSNANDFKLEIIDNMSYFDTLQIFRYLSKQTPLLSCAKDGRGFISNGHIAFALSEHLEAMSNALNKDREMREKLGTQGQMYIKHNYEYSVHYFLKNFHAILSVGMIDNLDSVDNEKTKESIGDKNEN